MFKYIGEECKRSSVEDKEREWGEKGSFYFETMREKELFEEKVYPPVDPQEKYPPRETERFLFKKHIRGILVDGIIEGAKCKEYEETCEIRYIPSPNREEKDTNEEDDNEEKIHDFEVRRDLLHIYSGNPKKICSIRDDKEYHLKEKHIGQILEGVECIEYREEMVKSEKRIQEERIPDDSTIENAECSRLHEKSFSYPFQKSIIHGVCFYEISILVSE